MRRRALFVAVVLLWAVPAWAQPAVDAATQGRVTSSDTLTYAHTVSGSNRLLVVCVANDSGGFRSISGVTYNGTAMTELYDSCPATSTQCLAVYTLVAPATGANNVVVTASGTTDITAGSVSFTNVDQATPHDTVDVVDNANSSTTSNDVTSATGDLVVDCVSSRDSTSATEGASQTERVDYASSGALEQHLITMSTEAGAATVTMSWSALAATADNTHAGLNINSAGGGGGSPVCTAMLLGVGPCD